MQITEIEVQTILQTKKIAVREMKWQAKQGGYNPTRYEFHTAIQIHNEVREDLFFRAQYRGSYHHNVKGVSVPKDENISVGLYVANHRIFAYDYDTTPHTNRIGMGKPYYLHTISGLHKHIWTAEGYGYAEPFSLASISLKAIIEQFLADSSTDIPKGFQPVPAEQYRLFDDET